MNTKLFALVAVFTGGLALRPFAAAPIVTRAEPSAAVPGGTSEITFSGENLEGSLDLWTSFSCEVSPADPPGQPTFKLKIPQGVPPGLGAIRLITTNGVSNPQLFLIDSIPSVASGGTNHSLATARIVARPGSFDGVCQELRSDFYQLRARKGERCSIEVVAQRTGSALDPLLRLLDSQGGELAANDDAPGLGSDARLDFRFPKTGGYFVEVRDTRYAGGPRHRYQLRVDRMLPTPLLFLFDAELAPLMAAPVASDSVLEREPNDTASQAQRVKPPVEVAGRFAQAGDRDVYEFHANEGDRLLISGRTRSLASPCDLYLQLQDSHGAKVAEANANSADEGRLTNRFDRTDIYRLVVEELNRGGGPGLNYRLAIEPLPPGFSLSLETERVSVPAGDSFEIEVQAQRRDYDGPIDLALMGLPDRFSVSNALIPAKTNTTKIKVTVPPDLSLGDFRHFGITGNATIGETHFSARASTLPALRNVFPDLRHPPRELDGPIALSIAASKSTTGQPQKKRRK